MLREHNSGLSHKVQAADVLFHNLRLHTHTRHKISKQLFSHVASKSNARSTLKQKLQSAEISYKMVRCMPPFLNYRIVRYSGPRSGGHLRHDVT